MSKFDEKVDFYKAKCKDLGIAVDHDLLVKCTKACGPSIYNDDAETIASSNQEELDRVKKNYLVGKLGLGANDDLDGLINYAVDTLGKSNRNKYRAIFYYLLSKKSGKSPA